MPKITIDANRDDFTGLTLRAYALIYLSNTADKDKTGSGNYAMAIIQFTGAMQGGPHLIVMQQPVAGVNAVPGYAIVWARSDDDHNHSERVIADMLGGFRVAGVGYSVIAVFSERQPCPTCTITVDHWVADWSHVYWIADYGADTNQNNAARWIVRDFRQALPSLRM
jgi:nucleic acid/nucleotide deaminase of polymorphic system toxin